VLYPLEVDSFCGPFAVEGERHPQPLKPSAAADASRDTHKRRHSSLMAKIAKTGGRKKVMDTTKSTNCPKCGKPTRIVKRVKDRERGVPGGVYISCSACEFYEKL